MVIEDPPDAADPALGSVLAAALRIRRVEELLLGLFAQGRLTGTVHTCIGQEYVGAALGAFIESGDTVFSNHRNHGHFLAVTGNVTGLLAEVMGRTGGVNGGRGGSQHLHQDGFISGGVLGGLVPVAAGRARAHQMAGQDRIAVAFIGDGTLGQGVVYETFNVASLWRLPLLVVMENNRVAQSSEAADTIAGSVGGRAEAFGITVMHADTWHLPDLISTSRVAVSRVRSGAGPVFLVVDTYRLAPHSKGDDHRDPDLIARYRVIDPLQRLLSGLGDLDAAIRAEIAEALSEAEASAEPTAASGESPVAPGAGPSSLCVTTRVEWRPATQDGRRYAAAQRDALARLLGEDPTLVLLGEDLRDPYGGAFKVTAGLSTCFPDRVWNTPISEAAIVGLGAGLALGGRRALVEIMFGDFVTLAMDQLVNQVAKLRQVYGTAGPGQVVLRTPMGGHRGYGPTHSQTLDRHLIGIPGLRVAALNSLIDPYEVYHALLTDDGEPSVVLENKALYGTRMGATVPAGFRALVGTGPLPPVRVTPGDHADLTLVGYGGMLESLLDAAERLFTQHDLLADVVCPTLVYPLGLDVSFTTPAVVVAEEGQGFAGFGAEILARLAEQSTGQLPRVRRVAAARVAIPAARGLEETALPSADHVVAAALDAAGAR
jgi:2-oxoisovalerate dehydrogenase E1 component